MTDKAPERAEALEKRAESLCIEWGHYYLGTEHLLMAAADMSPNVDSALRSLGAEKDTLTVAIFTMIEKGDGRPLWEGIYRSPRLKRVLERAATEAQNARSPRIEPEHVVLAILAEGKGVACMALQKVHVDLAQLRAAVKAPPSERKPAKAKEEKLLKQYGRDLVALAKDGKLDPVIGRADETRRVMQVIIRKNKNNAVLIGEAGVGKTAVVLGLAQRIASGNVPEDLRNTQVWELSMTGMLAGAKHRGEFEERLHKVIEEVSQSPDILLFIDELHTIVGAGDSKGGMDASNMLKPMLASGDLSLIGCTTTDEYRKYIEADPALARRFQSVLVPEPSEDETLQILRGLKEKYEKHHSVRFEDDALLAAVKLSTRYIPDRQLPDKAIDLIDEAAAKVKMRSGEFTPDMKYVVTSDVIAEVVAGWTDIPVGELQEDEEARLLRMEEELHRRVVGQEKAIETVAETVRMVRMGLASPTRPAGVFMFVGPSGVGKTELAKALAQFLFKSEKDLIRLDMSEYAEKAATNRLIGSPPGYVGHDEEGQLTKAVRTKPYSVVLLDEIEKAHPDVYDMFLQVFDDARLTDSKGRTVNFANTIIIMTSNLGLRTKDEQGNIAFTDITLPGARDIIMNEVKKFFKVELINRIDEIVLFEPLKREQVTNIGLLMVGDVKKRMQSERNIELHVGDGAMAVLVDEGFNPQLGARPLRRAVESMLSKPLAKWILQNKAKPGDVVCADAEERQLVFRFKPRDGNGQGWQGQTVGG
ncbi:MAG TPA: ATP-dependent Clp protease ATP-binding subunit [Candidatus Xenobia bacterium]